MEETLARVIFLKRLFAQTITTITVKPILQKRQSTKYVSTHYNLHITTYNTTTYSVLLTEKKRLTNSFLGQIGLH